MVASVQSSYRPGDIQVCMGCSKDLRVWWLSGILAPIGCRALNDKEGVVYVPVAYTRGLPASWPTYGNIEYCDFFYMTSSAQLHPQRHPNKLKETRCDLLIVQVTDEEVHTCNTHMEAGSGYLVASSRSHS